MEFFFLVNDQLTHNNTWLIINKITNSKINIQNGGMGNFQIKDKKTSQEQKPAACTNQ